MSSIKMTSGQHNTILLDKNGKVWSWGHNQYGQNGNGKKTGMDPNPIPEPVIPSWGENVKITDICAGHNHAAALDENGSVWYWGWDNFAAPPFPGAAVIGGKAVPEQVVIRNADGIDMKIMQIAGGGWNMLALDEEGTLWSWGSNGFGQLGVKALDIGTGTKSALFTPAPVDVLPEGIKIKSFAVGGQHVAVLDENGEVWTYGWNQYGQLGNANAKTGLNAYEKIAVKVDGLHGITKVSASYYHTMVMDEAGNIYAWGSNQYGQLGNDTIPTGPNNPAAMSAVPVPVTGLDGAKAADIGAGYEHSVILDKDGNIWSWGYNLYGQVGVPNVSCGDFSSYVKKPMKLCEWKDERGNNKDVKIKSIMCLTNHTMAVDTDDNVWGWGFNRYGQLGNGLSDDMNLTPTLVMWQIGTDISPEPFALAHITADDENGELQVDQAGFHATVYADFGKASGMLKDITLKFTDTKENGIFADLKKDDVRIMEDRFAIAFASHMHMDFENNGKTISLGLKLRDKESYDTPKTVKLRFVNEYNEFGMPVKYDVYYITFAALKQ
ncbi:MAG: hypothetical protein LIO59_05140 [Oscillospiraceae bacterium]|nr:hypothetical protein [Oscillospiraceae bacterium]